MLSDGRVSLQTGLPGLELPAPPHWASSSEQERVASRTRGLMVNRKLSHT